MEISDLRGFTRDSHLKYDSLDWRENLNRKPEGVSNEIWGVPVKIPTNALIEPLAPLAPLAAGPGKDP